MAQFPRYESKGELTTQQPAALAPESTAGKIAALKANSMAATVDTGVKFVNALETIQKTTAETNFKTGMVDIINRAQNDPNPNNSKQYTDEIDKLKSDNTKGIFGNRIGQELDYQSKVGAIQLNNIYKKKAIDVGQASILTNIDTDINNPTHSSRENIQKVLGISFDAKGEMTATPGGNVATGVISHEDAYKLYQKSDEKLKQNEFSYDLNSSPQTAGEKIKTNQYNFSPKDVIIAQRKVDYMKKDSQDKLEATLTRRSIDGDLNMQETEDLFKNNLISRSFYHAMKETLDSTEVATHTDTPTYNQLTAMLVNPNTKPDDARLAILKANADGKLNKKDLQSLFTSHLIPSQTERTSLESSLGNTGKDDFEKNVALNDAVDRLQKEKKEWWRSAFYSLENKIKDESTVAEAKKKLYESANNEDFKPSDLPKMTEKVVAGINLKNNPTWGALPKEGRVGKDRYGNKVRVFPDGHISREE